MTRTRASDGPASDAVARRVSEIRLSGAALDANYTAVKADLYPWRARHGE